MTSQLEQLANQLRQVSADIGLGSGDYQLIRRGTNDVFACRESGVVARVAPDYFSQTEVESRLLDCQELAAAGAPVLAPLISEAAVLPGGRYVGFWPLAEVEPRPDGHEMAEVLATCHRLAPPDRLSHWTPDLFVDRRWATLKTGVGAGLPSDMAETLNDLFVDSLNQLKDLCNRHYNPSDGLFIHGDTHHSNFVRYRGRLVLCDPDNICRGPKEKDLANVWECCRRHYIEPEYWQQFKDNYRLGYNQKLLDILTRVQEIGGCMWMAQFWGPKPEARPAIAHNIETINQLDARWLDF